MQSRLRALGYLNDTADGVFGANTEEAVKQAQATLGMDQTGEANGRFLYRLFTEL